MRKFFRARVAYHRMRRHIEWRRHPRAWATARSGIDEYLITVAERTSPLQRAPDGDIAAYTEEKTQNLRLAAAHLHRCVIEPGQVFSFCRIVGKTTRREGYLPALELHQGDLKPSVGGGLCQIANLLFLLAIDVNADIVERHRHSFDLFRDVERSVPFGCGATVFYNYIDFQWRNALPFPLWLGVSVEPPLLRAEVRAQQPLPFRTHIVETDHRFFRRGGHIYRANRLWKEIERHDGQPPLRELLFVNECRVLYPADDLVANNQGNAQ